MNKKRLFGVFGFILGALLLFVGGFFAGSAYVTDKYQDFLGSISLKRESNSLYPLVHPILGFNSQNSLTVDQFGPLSQKIQGVFSSNISSVSRYSVYFRDQDKGFWVGINEDDTFNPASMLKVALAMATYKQAEADPEFLNLYKLYTPELAKINTSLPNALPSELSVGDSYQVEDLIQKMLIDSDNGAKDILGNTVNPDIVSDVYKSLNIDIPKDGQDYSISAKKYTGFFRNLYNATYLNKDYSNRLLTLLSKATFDSGLIAGVPSGTTVSHKYGESVSNDNTTINNVQLHDCGVIYFPDDPYILCVMTQGKSQGELAGVIADVSKVVYDEVRNKYK